jgi:hypothetical protein
MHRARIEKGVYPNSYAWLCNKRRFRLLKSKVMRHSQRRQDEQRVESLNFAPDKRSDNLSRNPITTASKKHSLEKTIFCSLKNIVRCIWKLILNYKIIGLLILLRLLVIHWKTADCPQRAFGSASFFYNVRCRNNTQKGLWWYVCKAIKHGSGGFFHTQ